MTIKIMSILIALLSSPLHICCFPTQGANGEHGPAGPPGHPGAHVRFELNAAIYVDSGFFVSHKMLLFQV